MIIDIDSKSYRHRFSFDPHPYLSDPFIELYKSKVTRIVRLAEDQEKASLGLIAGINNGILKSPFSAPFGGFHFRNNRIYTGEIDRFLSQLILYVIDQNLNEIKLILPPDIYCHALNSKITNSLLRNGFSMDIPEITNWVDLKKFDNNMLTETTKRHYNHSLKNNLSFRVAHEYIEKKVAYDMIYQNRKMLGRPIYMTFNDLIEVENLWPVDFFIVEDKEGSVVASSVNYRGHPRIVQGIFWGDNDYGRRLHAVNFCSYNLWNHYKNLGFDFMDFGISTEAGIPNEGLIRFKEDHNCESALRYSFTWNR